MILSLSSFSEAAAKWWLGVSEIALLGFAVVLVLGLIGEWPESESWRKKKLYKIAKVAVVLGVLGELFADAGIFETSNRLQEIVDSSLASAEHELARIKSPRVLTTDQKERLVKKLEKYEGTPFVFTVIPDSETVQFMNQIGAMLEDAKWTRKAFNVSGKSGIAIPGKPSVGLVILSGIEMRVGDPALAEQMKALSDALIAEGVVVYPPSGEGVGVPGAVNIFVGSKPL